MSDESDILQKADALLHRRAIRNEPDFPVLTEVVDTHPPAPPSPVASVMNTGDSVEPPRTITRIDIEELEHRILETILPAIELQLAELIRSTILPHVCTLLDRSIKAACEEASRSTTSRATERLNETIKATIQTELSKLRTRIFD